jgi:hypothetical protein
MSPNPRGSSSIRLKADVARPNFDDVFTGLMTQERSNFLAATIRLLPCDNNREFFQQTHCPRNTRAAPGLVPLNARAQGSWPAAAAVLDAFANN